MPDSPDRMAWLIGQLASGDPGAEVLRELPAAVHSAIHPLCLSLAGSVDGAYDAEQETWRRLLEHIARHHPRDLEIGNGTAYVRQIARNVCRDLGRRTRREVDIDEVAEQRFSTGDPAWAEATVAAGSVPGSVRSPRVLRDLAGLSDQERAVLGLRQTGRSYQEIALSLGGGLTAATAQTQGERALHHLRGRVHVEVWLREGWSVPACPELARLKAETRDRVLAGKPVTTTLYREIGRHLDPRPKRGFCQLCQPERKRSELVYWWLIASLPPVLAGTQLATAQPAEAAEHPRRRRRPRGRNLGIGAVAVSVIVALVVLAIVIIPRRDTQNTAGSPAGSPAGPGTSVAGGDPADPAFPRPEPCKLLSQDDVAKAMGQPVDACQGFPMKTAGAPMDIKEAAGAAFTSPSVDGDSVHIYTYKLGADPRSAFAALCRYNEEVDRLMDHYASTGPVPGVGEESCSFKYRTTTKFVDLGVTALIARKGTIAVVVTVLWTKWTELPTDLVKLALSRVR